MVDTIPATHTCGGKIIFEVGAFQCVECGKEWVTQKEKGELYNEVKDMILADVRTIGPTATERRWHISCSGLRGCTIRWTGKTPLIIASGTKLAAEELEKEPGPGAEDLSPVPEPVNNHMAPELPAWSDTWTESVQLKWLDIFQERR